MERKPNIANLWLIRNSVTQQSFAQQNIQNELGGVFWDGALVPLIQEYNAYLALGNIWPLGALFLKMIGGYFHCRRLLGKSISDRFSGWRDFWTLWRCWTGIQKGEDDVYLSVFSSFKDLPWLCLLWLKNYFLPYSALLHEAMHYSLSRILVSNVFSV